MSRCSGPLAEVGSKGTVSERNRELMPHYIAVGGSSLVTLEVTGSDWLHFVKA